METATSISVTLTDQTTAVAKLAANPMTTNLRLKGTKESPLSRLSSQIPSKITKAPKTAVAVTDWPSKNVPKIKLNNGYVAASGTARATPTLFKPTKYNVSPMTNPTTPLATVTTTTPAGKLANAPTFPSAKRTNSITAALLTHRTIFAEIGDVLNNARLYRIGATDQLTAAPKAASSPSNTSLMCKPLRKAAVNREYINFPKQKPELS